MSSLDGSDVEIMMEIINDIRPLCELHVIDEEVDDPISGGAGHVGPLVAPSAEAECEEDPDWDEEEEFVVGSDCEGDGSGEQGDSGKDDIFEVPKKGMIFDSVQQMENFYQTYAKAVGFGVIRRGAYSDKHTKVKKSQYWHCDRGPPVKGKHYSDSPEVAKKLGKRTCKSKKVGCPAGMSGFLNQDGLWELKNVELTHVRHTPKPSDIRFIPGWRSVPKHLLNFITNLMEAGVSQSKIYVALANQLNGFDKVPFLLTDLNNQVTKQRILKLESGDAEAMFDYMNRMQEMNKEFFYSVRRDEYKRLTDIVWVDARSREAYKDFGDVVCFDATYITNNYELPFANFVGVNHHGHSILLGCALITHEDTETYKWVMEEWLRAMYYKPPGGIITDQSTPMRNAIEEVFPSPKTKHRLCVWHILNKVPKKFIGMKRLKEFHKHITSVVYDSLCTSEFEFRWKIMLCEFGLEKDGWLIGLYDDRYHWVPAYVIDSFWAGMSTTQRIESIHHFFKGFLNSKTSLRDFVHKYSRAIEHRINAEQIADSVDERRKPQVLSHLMVEKFFNKVYTYKKFIEVQKECHGLIHCVPQLTREIESDVFQYVIQDRVWIGEPGRMVQRDYEVIYDKVNEDFSCECRLFQSRGILCRHIIRVMDMVSLCSVPPKYVLDRWRKNLKRKHTEIKVAFNDPHRTASDIRYGKLQYEYERVFKIAQEREDLCEHAVEVGLRLCEELEAMSKESECDGNTENTQSLNGSGQANGGIDSEFDEFCGNGSSMCHDTLAPLAIQRPGRPRKGRATYEKPSKKSKSSTSTEYSVNQPNQVILSNSAINRNNGKQHMVNEDAMTNVCGSQRKAAAAAEKQLKLVAAAERKAAAAAQKKLLSAEKKAAAAAQKKLQLAEKKAAAAAQKHLQLVAAAQQKQVALAAQQTLEHIIARRRTQPRETIAGGSDGHINLSLTLSHDHIPVTVEGTRDAPTTNLGQSHQ